MDQIVDRLKSVQKSQGLTALQMATVVDSVNVMFATVMQVSSGIASVRSDIDGLRRLLDERLSKIEPDAASIAKFAADAREWEERYKELLQRWQVLEGSSELHEQVGTALAAADLDTAGDLLDRILRQQDRAVKAAAATHFSRAEVFRLRFKLNEAVKHYERAWSIDPTSAHGAAYGTALFESNRVSEAVAVFDKVWKTLFSEQAGGADPKMQLADLVRANGILLHLGHAYRRLERLRDAESAYMSIIALHKRMPALAHLAPEAVPMALDSLGNLYRLVEHWDEAIESHNRARALFDELAKTRPSFHEQSAMSRMMLATVYLSRRMFGDAVREFESSCAYFRSQRPGQARIEHGLAQCLGNLAGALEGAGQPAKSLQTHIEALQAFRSLVARDESFRFSLAVEAHNTAEALDRAGQGQDAVSFSAESVEAVSRLVRLDARSHLRMCVKIVAYHAQLQVRVGDGAGARQTLDQGIALLDRYDGTEQAVEFLKSQRAQLEIVKR